MIQFQQVNKQYNFNDFELKDINFHVDTGEFIFLIGPSGSGKTTVIKLLIREEVPTSGKIFFDEYDITRLSQGSTYKLRRQIGVIFQDYKLVPDRNVYENVAFAMEVAGKSSKEIKETVPYLLDLVGLSNRAKAFPDYLSGGEKQRAAIARAVANNPKILIADEPTGNLDPAAAWDIVQILSKINNWGTTVIMSTHGSDIVNTLNKRVIQMQDGKIIRDDRQGGYEITSGSIDTPKLDLLIPEDVEGEKKAPIKVKLKKTGKQTAKAENYSSWWSRLFNFGQKTSEAPAGQALQMKAKPEAEEKEVSVETQDMKKILEDADNTPLSELDLAKEVVADLKTAGFEDVEDVITAGIEKVAENKVIDTAEVVAVAQAIEEFVVEEEQELAEGKTKNKKQETLARNKEDNQTENKEKEDKKQVTGDKDPSPNPETPNPNKAKRVKISLTSSVKPK